MKKILAMLLAVMMLLSVASVAMAEGTTIATDAFKKVYNLTNEGTTSPEETFRFTLTCTNVTDAREGIDETDAPALTATIGAMTAGNTENISLSANKDFPSIGWYTYTITETAGNTAGVTYDNTPRTLKVLVVNDDANGGLKIQSVAAVKNSDNTKDDTFTNVYSAGALSIEKQVTGNLGDKDKYFTVTVTLTGENGKTYADSYAVTGGKYTAGETIKVGEPKTFELKNGDTITIANLPYGVTYTVVENDYTGNNGGYDAATYTGDTGENAKIDGATQNVTITNNKGGTIDTGVMLDSMPYVLVLAVVGAAVIALIAKKRRVED